jgi:hypothetical protein
MNKKDYYNKVNEDKELNKDPLSFHLFFHTLLNSNKITMEIKDKNTLIEYIKSLKGLSRTKIVKLTRSYVNKGYVSDFKELKKLISENTKQILKNPTKVYTCLQKTIYIKDENTNTIHKISSPNPGIVIKELNIKDFSASNKLKYKEQFIPKPKIVKNIVKIDASKLDCHKEFVKGKGMCLTPKGQEEKENKYLDKNKKKPRIIILGENIKRDYKLLNKKELNTLKKSNYIKPHPADPEKQLAKQRIKIEKNMKKYSIQKANNKAIKNRIKRKGGYKTEYIPSKNITLLSVKQNKKGGWVKNRQKDGTIIWKWVNKKDIQPCPFKKTESSYKKQYRIKVKEDWEERELKRINYYRNKQNNKLKSITSINEYYTKKRHNQNVKQTIKNHYRDILRKRYEQQIKNKRKNDNESKREK